MSVGGWIKIFTALHSVGGTEKKNGFIHVSLSSSSFLSDTHAHTHSLFAGGDRESLEVGGIP